MANVLVLNGHVKQSLVAIRSLGRRGLDVTVGSCRRWSTGRLSRYGARFHRTPDPETEPEAFLRSVEGELRSRSYDVVLPVTEATVELVVRHRSRFADHAAVPFPPFETLAVGLDKAETVAAARRFDVPHPRTMCHDEVDLAAAGDALGYPVVVKPHRGSSRNGVSVCGSRAELESTYRETVAEHGPTLLQEFVPNGGERGVYTLYDGASRLAGVTVQERLRSKPPEGGASTYRETVADPELVETADDLLSSLGWEGVAMAEFRVDPRDGRAKLLEINPRLWGSLALSIFAGVDFPYRLYALAVGEECPADLSYDAGVRARCLFTDLLQVTQRDDRLRAIAEYLTPSAKPVRHDVVSLRDPLPIVGQALLAFGDLATALGTPVPSPVGSDPTPEADGGGTH